MMAGPGFLGVDWYFLSDTVFKPPNNEVFIIFYFMNRGSTLIHQVRSRSVLYHVNNVNSAADSVVRERFNKDLELISKRDGKDLLPS